MPSTMAPRPLTPTRKAPQQLSSPPHPSSARPSKFTEGIPTTLPSPPSSNTLLFNILSEQDRHESARRRTANRDSTDSTDSLSSTSSGGKIDDPDNYRLVAKEGRRNIVFGREDRRSIDEVAQRDRENAKTSGEGGLRKFKGRLRALTGGKSTDGKPFSAT